MREKNRFHNKKKKQDSTKYLRKNIPLDYIYSVINNLNMSNSIWVLYLAYRGMDLMEIGLLEGIYHITSILFEVPSGALADLMGRKKSLLIGRFLMLISALIMMFATEFWMFGMSFVIQALGNNFNSGSENALVYDSLKLLGREKEYITVNSRVNILIEFAQAVSTVLGGVLAEYSYFWCYFACVLLAGISIFPLAFMKEPDYKGTGSMKNKNDVETQIILQELSFKSVIIEHFHKSFRLLRANDRIIGVITGYSSVFAFYTVLFFYSQTYYYNLGKNKIEISVIMLLVGIVSCLGAYFSVRIYNLLKTKVLFVGALLIGVGICIYGLGNLFFSVSALMLASFINAVLYPIQSKTLNELVPSEQRATLLSVDSMFFSIIMIFIFPVIGGLADWIGLNKIFLGLGVFLLVLTFISQFIMNLKQNEVCYKI